MTSTKKVMPIIRASARLHEYPFRAISSHMLLLMRSAAASNRRDADSCVERMVKVIEGALRVMGREMRDFDDIEFELSCELVTGALSSPTFLEASTARRRDFVGFFRKTVLAMSKLQPRLRISSPLFTNLTRATADDLERHRRAFEHLDLVSDEVWLWRGWYPTRRHPPDRCPTQYAAHDVQMLALRSGPSRHFCAVNAGRSHQAAQSATNLAFN